MTKRAKADWVVAGGAPGELGYCTRCGQGLTINLPQLVPVIVAAMKAFADVHSTCPPGEYFEKPVQTPQEWVMGRDTGVSSLTIYCAMTGNRREHYDAPYDPADFGRCYRLLKLFPAWNSRLEEVSRLCFAFGPLIEHWSELTELYERELPSGSAPELYRRIKELRGVK